MMVDGHYASSLDEPQDPYARALLSLTEEEAEYASTLEPDEFWAWWAAR
jgi:hypothetical protein